MSLRPPRTCSTRAGDILELGNGVSWLTLDSGGHGYYRWRLAREQMSTLADEAVEVLSAAERIAFLGNVEALLNAGSVTGAEYLGYLKSSGHDPEAGVVRAVLGGLSKVEMAFKTEDLEPLLAEYVRQALSPAVERFGLTRKEGEEESVSLLRPQLFGCGEEILGKATKFFSQPEHQVDRTLDSLEKATDVTTDCLNLRHREGDSVREYLAQVAAD